MPESTSNNTLRLLQPQYLWLLTTTFTIFLILNNWYDPRIIRIFSFSADSGILLYPGTLMIIDVITEVYGFKKARLTIWFGFITNLLVMLYGQIVSHLPTLRHYHVRTFDHLLNVNARIVTASALAYFATEPLNSFINAKMKIALQGRYIGLRFILSSIISSITGALIFYPLAFWGIIANGQFIRFAFQSWVLFVAIQIILLPFSVRLARWLKHKENIDIYDTHTKFTIFSLSTHYEDDQNQQSDAPPN